MTDDVMIELQQVSKSYRGQQAPAVQDVSMTISRGEIVVLVGPSGCGKTTTMKMINRLIEPTSRTDPGRRFRRHLARPRPSYAAGSATSSSRSASSRT